MRTFRLLFAFLCISCAYAQQGNGNTATANPKSPQAEDAWGIVRQYDRTISPISHRSSPSNTSQTQIDEGAEYIQRANALDAYLTAYPDSSHASEARRIEAFNLLNAVYRGAKSDSNRCTALVADVRKDSNLPATERFAVAMMADLQSASQDSFASDEARQALVEKTLRALIAEFPTIPQPIQTYLSFAECCTAPRSTRIASDTLSMPNLPDSVRAKASRLQSRYALLGKSILGQFAGASAISSLVARSKHGPVIVYSWASWDEGSLMNGSTIEQYAPQSSIIIGINVDNDVALAKQTAADKRLPGFQLYDPSGLASVIAAKLGLPAEGVVIIADKNGTIKSVDAQIQLIPSLEAAN